MKVAHQYSWPSETTNYDKALYEKNLSYLAPEEVKDLSIGRAVPESAFAEAEAFSAGLTLLDATLLTDSKDLYGKKFTFDFETLNGRRVNLANEGGYSEELKHVILNLTEFEPEERVTLAELNEWLGPYQEQIERKVEFKPSTKPNKLQETAVNNPIKIRDF